MRKQLFAVVLSAAIPLAAAAQGVGPPPTGGAPRLGQVSGQRPGPSPERFEKRMRLARTLGLAEALDLDAPAALKLGEAIGKLDERRLAAHKTMHESREVLRRAAQGEKVPAADVDQAIQKALDARAQLQAIDRETVATVTQGLSPEKKARAVLFLTKFQHRFQAFGRHMMGPGGPGMGPGDGMGPGMGPWRRGRGGPDGGTGMGPGACGPMLGMAPPLAGDDLDDGPED